MHAVTRKLKSRSGISMAIALVFFLLCAMVGAVVLSDASASAASTARERQLYRETVALTSAADLLRQDMKDMKFTGSYTSTETVTTTVDPTGKQKTKVDTSEEKELAEPKLEGSKLFTVETTAGTYSDPLNLILRFKCKQSLETTSLTEPSPQTIKFLAVEAQHIPEVTGTVTVEEDYTLTVKLQCGENSMTMSFPPQTDSQTVIADPVTKKESDSVTKKTTVTTYSTILTWGQPLLREGGADDA